MKRLALLLLLLLFPALATAQPVILQGFENNEDVATTGIEMGTTSGTKSMVTTPVHGGTYAFRCNPTTTGTCLLPLRATSATGQNSTTNPNTADCYTLFAFQVADAPDSDSEEIGHQQQTGASAVKLYLRINADRTLQLYDKDNAAIAGSLTTTALALDTWYWILLHAQNGTSGTYDLTLYNDVVDSAALETKTGTANQLATNCGPFHFGKANNRNGQTVDFYYDDIVMRTTTAPVRGKIRLMVPNASGTTGQWVNGTGSTFAEVDEVRTDGDTTYLLNTITASDTHALNLVSSATAGIGASDTINYVSCGGFVREDTSVTSAFQIGCLAGGTTTLTTANNMTTTYQPHIKHTLVDPSDSAAWTIADLDALQVHMIENNAVSLDRATKMWAMVQSQEPAPVASNFIVLEDY